MPQPAPTGKTNLTLIGMPGAGKSTLGVILAKRLGLGFLDTDLLIQTSEGRSLQDILDVSGHLRLRAIEAREILKIHVNNCVIATGGSAVYSEEAMAHLRDISRIVFLDVPFEEIQRRIRNFDTRGIAKAKDQTFEELFQERQALYRKYADVIIDGDDSNQEALAERIARSIA